MEHTDHLNRDYSTISPSAMGLLLLKGLTNIPFAKEAATLAIYPQKYKPDFSITDVGFWARAVHFESRYWSIDQLLNDLNAKNILELSSGFSFRGLEAVKKDGIHFIDTDLENVIDTKKKFTAQLQVNSPGFNSKLETLPLNALNEEQFIKTINRFEKGEIIIVNEGLLVYLDTAEKERLCQIIRNVLQKRGGYWITADIYIKREMGPGFKMNDDLTKFFEQHKIEENKFDSFEAAGAFFNRNGFIIDQEAVRDNTKLTSVNYLLQNASPEQLQNLRRTGKVHATWRLKLA